MGAKVTDVTTSAMGGDLNDAIWPDSSTLQGYGDARSEAFGAPRPLRSLIIFALLLLGRSRLCGLRSGKFRSLRQRLQLADQQRQRLAAEGITPRQITLKVASGRVSTVSLVVQHVPLELQFRLDRIPQAGTAECAQEPQQLYLVPPDALVITPTSGGVLAGSAV
jgi:hypothetical protein